MKKLDPEARYLIALRQLGPRARALYDQYGDLMEVLPPSRNKTAKKLGASVNTVKEVITFVEVWGGPGKNAHRQPDAEGRAPAHFIIPDAHFDRKDRYDGFKRARRLGEYMAIVYLRCIQRGQELRVVCLGDWWDMVSLCKYDAAKTSFGHNDVKEDIETGDTAMAVMMEAFNGRCVASGVDYTQASDLSFTFTNGNHELRLDKARSEAATAALVKGLPTHKSIVEGYGWRFHDYMVPANIDGVAYAHCLPSGVMGRPIGGVNAAKSLLDKMLVSCVVGHSHTYDLCLRTDAFGNTRFGLVAGCYYDRVPEYAKTTAQMWWRGVFLLNGVRNGALIRGVSAITVEDMVDTVGY